MAAQDQDNSPGLSLLDFLFTAAIGLGLSAGGVGTPSGILGESWILKGQWPSATEGQRLLTFALAFLIFALSWFGYHAAIRRLPLNWDSQLSPVRFIVDVLLVVLYAILFIEYGNAVASTFLVVLIYLLYVVWDIISRLEYRQSPRLDLRYPISYRDEIFGMVALFLFGAIFVVQLRHAVSDTTAVVLAIVLSLVYRWGKYHVRDQAPPSAPEHAVPT